MVEFQRGIGFLVLAIGIYGIGEMLWTLEHTKGKVQVQTVRTTWARFSRAASKSIAYTKSSSGWEARVDARACKNRRRARKRRRRR